MTAVLPATLADGLAAVLRGEGVPWGALGAEPADVIAACAEEDLTGLVHRWLAARPSADWPRAVRAELERRARAGTMREALRRRELTGVLEALAAQGILPILFKGTPLAYGVYGEPGLRPRGDTDLLIRRDERERVRSAMSALGYRATNYSDGEFLFHQFEMARNDPFGVLHALDFHWKISTESVFADMLAYDELAADCAGVPALGPHARGVGLVHALLLACLHPVMHHRNVERLIWLYDIHLLASRLPPAAFDAFARLAVRKGVAAISARELDLARRRLGTRVPESVASALAARAGAEPSAAYLAPERRWSDELVSNVRGLPRWSDRLKLLREVAFPAPAYMLRAYGMAGGVASALLPALYVHRGVRGLWKVLRGRK